MREKVTSIKENYDKKFEPLFNHFRVIESLFLNGYFEQETLGDLKNGKTRQESILLKVNKSLKDLEKLKEDVTYLRQNK